MRYLSIAEVLDLHQRLLADSGGAIGVRDLGALESAVSQPHAAFRGQDLYPTSSPRPLPCATRWS